MRFASLFAAATCALASTSSVWAAHSGSTRALLRRDASTTFAFDSGATAKNTDGEDHGTPKVPNGAQLVTFPVGTKGHQAAVYWADSPKNATAKQAFVMIHGRMKDGFDYWTTMNDILQSALDADDSNADPNAIVVAPQFYSAKLNEGQYADDVLAWGDVNAWQAGEAAVHPDGATESSFDTLDAFIDEFNDKSKYPAMQRLIFVGHGGGGQLLNRYAIVGKDAPAGIQIRYVAGDPSSSVYFTTDRPVTDDTVASKKDCPLYNTWRYGFDNFTGTLQGLKTPQDYFAQTITRDVRYVVGYDDTASSGDQYCMAMLQGGEKRRDRNLSWWKYINTLARTAEDVSGLPGNFSNLPDWSAVSKNVISHHLTVIEGATHDAMEVFGSADGRSVLFDDANVPTGWRPAGWNPKGNGQKVAALSSSGASASGSSAPSGSHTSATKSGVSSSSSSSAAASSRSRVGVAGLVAPLVFILASTVSLL
ncbi:uncharacterized protein PFL1_02614 [Pseudozyma flocculosa PF-1]|uniref:Uncharacterized protein n=2 Tax=Pseudozyma flocculosa TaxID=84751 RepID=A0A5C3EYW6_9BASI|nr:uncharacterized protein PFL1_02614 [Pseudozyma flocculosa PF-1]EPQ29942.1 hypothetical protein PFL1_02614 [Pseudozyma flocculosa PF-1]SPO37252.1 uncharacterized protein PSFLO_02724 [Pseudozyma flocculosa]